MKQIIRRLQTVRLRQIIIIFLATVTFLVVPAFNYSASLQAQAASADVESGATVDRDTIKRIQEKAEDLGDSPERPIGDTGLENIKQLGEKIPKVIDLNIRQQGAKYNPNEPNKKEAIDESQKKVESGS